MIVLLFMMAAKKSMTERGEFTEIYKRIMGEGNILSSQIAFKRQRYENKIKEAKDKIDDCKYEIIKYENRLSSILGQTPVGKCGNDLHMLYCWLYDMLYIIPKRERTAVILAPGDSEYQMVINGKRETVDLKFQCVNSDNEMTFDNFVRTWELIYKKHNADPPPVLTAIKNISKYFIAGLGSFEATVVGKEIQYDEYGNRYYDEYDRFLDAYIDGLELKETRTISGEIPDLKYIYGTSEISESDLEINNDTADGEYKTDVLFIECVGL